MNEHRNDKRDFIYNLDTFENSDTHDDLWNAAQNQMRFNGKMHGYMRMYWAKKMRERRSIASSPTDRQTSGKDSNWAWTTWPKLAQCGRANGVRASRVRALTQLLC